MIHPLLLKWPPGARSAALALFPAALLTADRAGSLFAPSGDDTMYAIILDAVTLLLSAAGVLMIDISARYEPGRSFFRVVTSAALAITGGLLLLRFAPSSGDAFYAGVPLWPVATLVMFAAILYRSAPEAPDVPAEESSLAQIQDRLSGYTEAEGNGTDGSEESKLAHEALVKQAGAPSADQDNKANLLSRRRRTKRAQDELSQLGLPTKSNRFAGLWSELLVKGAAVGLVAYMVTKDQHWFEGYVPPETASGISGENDADRSQSGINDVAPELAPVINVAPNLAEYLPHSTRVAVGQRSSDGQFVFTAQIGGQDLTMAFDQDIQAVTLRAEDATRLGVSLKRVNFDSTIKLGGKPVPVGDIMIRNITVGEITYANVPGFVAKPGALKQNILGHTFSGRLKEWRVDQDRMTLHSVD